MTKESVSIAGTVIEAAFDSFANTGTATFISVVATETGFSIDSIWDHLVAYLASTNSPTSYLGALGNSTNFLLADPTTVGLAFGTTAIEVSSLPSPRATVSYDGPTNFANTSAALASIYDISNWVRGDKDASLGGPGPGAGGITLGSGTRPTVPEPSSPLIFLMLGCVLGFSSFWSRHRPISAMG